MDGKKTERMELPTQLRTDEWTAREIRALAALEHRSVQDEIRHLIALGLEQKRGGRGKEALEGMGQAASGAVRSEGPANVGKCPPVSVRVSPVGRRLAGD